MSSVPTTLGLIVAVCLVLLAARLEAVALPLRLEPAKPTAEIDLAEVVDATWTVRMRRGSDDTDTAAEAVAAASLVAGSRWRRGAEMVLLRAHICRQYKDRGVPPPPRYKC